MAGWGRQVGRLRSQQLGVNDDDETESVVEPSVCAEREYLDGAYGVVDESGTSGVFSDYLDEPISSFDVGGNVPEMGRNGKAGDSED